MILTSQTTNISVYIIYRVVKGDQVLENGKRIILFCSNDHLGILAWSQQVLGDGTFKITPKLWYQTFHHLTQLKFVAQYLCQKSSVCYLTRRSPVTMQCLVFIKRYIKSPKRFPVCEDSSHLNDAIMAKSGNPNVKCINTNQALRI